MSITVLSQFLVVLVNLLRRVWEALNTLTPGQLLSEGRVYGGGLHKLEPKELANVDATVINALRLSIGERQYSSSWNSVRTWPDS